MNAPLTDDALDASLDDIEFLARSDHRARVLNALIQGTRARRDLQSVTGASSPTMGRVLTDFQERRWIHRDGSTYELTRLGQFVADRFGDLCESMAIERKLRDVWRWLPREMEGFTVDLFADAVVSYPGPGYPYEPVERVAQLIGGSSRMRGFGTLELKAATLETVCGVVLDGMEMEYVFPPDILETAVAWNPERISQTAATENCSVFVHDDLPDGDRCGLSIVDDRVGICCHDPETGALQAVVDTDALEAREWAVSVFERYREKATPVEPDMFETFISTDTTA